MGQIDTSFHRTYFLLSHKNAKWRYIIFHCVKFTEIHTDHIVIFDVQRMLVERKTHRICTVTISVRAQSTLGGKTFLPENICKKN